MSDDTYTDTRSDVERVRALLDRKGRDYEREGKPSVRRTAPKAVVVLDDGERYGLAGRTVQVTLLPDPRRLDRRPKPKRSTADLLDGDHRLSVKPWRIDRGETIPLRGNALPRRYSLERVDDIVITEQATTAEQLFGIFLATGWDRAELIRAIRDYQSGRTTMAHLWEVCRPWVTALSALAGGRA